MAKAPKLTLHDHLLADTVTALLTCRIYDPAREKMWREILRDALARSNAQHPQVQVLRKVVPALLAHSGGTERIRAHLDAAAALVIWSEWRIGQAQHYLEQAVAA